MAKDIDTTIKEAMKRKLQQQDKEAAKKIAEKEALDAAKLKTDEWLETVVVPLMQEYADALNEQGVSASYNHNSINNNGPSALFRIESGMKFPSFEIPMSVSFSFRGVDDILVTYGDETGSRLIRGNEAPCRPTWPRESVKRLIDPVIEAFFAKVWKG